MGAITASTDIQQVAEKDVPRYTDLALQDIVRQVNGNLTFQDNISCKVLSVTFANANTPQAISHTLGRVPAGYLQAGSTVSGIVYNGNSGSSSNSISLQASAAGTYGLILF